MKNFWKFMKVSFCSIVAVGVIVFVYIWLTGDSDASELKRLVSFGSKPLPIAEREDLKGLPKKPWPAGFAAMVEKRTEQVFKFSVTDGEWAVIGEVTGRRNTYQAPSPDAEIWYSTGEIIRLSQMPTDGSWVEPSRLVMMRPIGGSGEAILFQKF